MSAENFIVKIKSHFSSSDLELIRHAYNFGERHHEGQKRASGEPFFSHCQAVSEILVTEIFVDKQACTAALLHDVVEDTDVEIKQIEHEFGSEIALLVDGVTKIERIHKKSRLEREVETLRKMMLSAARDVRVILIKLADRLHNMRTLDVLSSERQQRIATRTLEIYAPIAYRFGMGRIKGELEDLSFKYLYPQEFAKLKEKITQKRGEREALTESVRNLIIEKLSRETGLNNFKVVGRSKNLYSIYRKMQRRYSFDEIYDKIGLRIIFGDLESTEEINQKKHKEVIGECYQVLGSIHHVWTPLPDRIKDYIGNPKANGYQSLHTTVIIPEAGLVEIQIRTALMHKMAEEGVASHWRYKEENRKEAFAEPLIWLGRVLEADQNSDNPQEFLRSLKIELFNDDIFVYTPNGDVIQLPQKATVLDFAFAIHSQVGLTCSGGRLNGRIAKLSRQLKSGDQVEIIRSSSQNPNRDWLSFAVTSRARGKIRHFLRTKEFEHNAELGREKLLRETKAHGFRLRLIEAEFSDLIEEYSQKSFDHFLAAVGSGDISPHQVLRKLFPEEEVSSEEPDVATIPAEQMRQGMDSVNLKDVGNVLLRFAKCCEPIPGDDIIGFITRGRGLTVHQNSCRNIAAINDEDRNRLIDVRWDVPKDDKFSARVWIRAQYSQTFLERLNKIVEKLDSSVEPQIRINKNEIYGILLLKVSDLNHLDAVIRHLRTMKEIREVNRAKG